MSLLMAFEQGRIQTPYGDSEAVSSPTSWRLNSTASVCKRTVAWKSGTHDDLAMSLALANWATKEFKAPLFCDDKHRALMSGFVVKPHRSQNDNPADGWMIP